MAIPSWLQLSEVSGSGDTQITITASTNTELNERIHNLVISGNTKTTMIPIKQSALRPQEMYLTFDILTGGTIEWQNLGSSGWHRGTTQLQYCKNKSGQWTTIYSSDTGETINVNTGDIIEFRGNNSYTTAYFYGTAKYNAYGNIMSLINATDFQNTTMSESYIFGSLFMDTQVLDAGGLFLPSSGLTEGCYINMFAFSTITNPPKLPATTLAKNCYSGMFAGCRNLINAPELPATTLPNRAYQFMFNGSTALTYVKCLATSGLENAGDWLMSIHSNGTFVKDPNTTWPYRTHGDEEPTHDYGIPREWTIVDAT